jgi:hypothetical protein
MAKIFIKGRNEPLEVQNEIAKQVKHRWCGDVSTGAGKAEKSDIVDLGDWAGEYGQIRCIELDRYIPPARTRPVETIATRTVKIVPINYELNEGERFI